MIRLFSLIYTFVGATLAGSLIVAALTMNMFDTRSIIIAAAAGFAAGAALRLDPASVLRVAA